MSQLINIFLEPGKVFAELKEKPTFVMPALLAIVAAAVSMFIYFLYVDPEWFANHQLQALGSEMSKAELEQMSKMMPGARTSGYIALASIAIVTPIIYCIFSLYYLLAGKITGNVISFKQGLSLTAWSSLPMILGSVLMLVTVFTSSPQSSLESMQLLNIDPLLVQLPMDHDWSRLAKSFSLLNFWVWFLAALGWKTWFRTGWGQALGVVLLPSIVIYGVMALFALL
ncbi:MAG: hypothetical protein DCF27_12900 [Lysobacteraceae bacterium]|nr:MAG: hypothetical protein DCF27_12900 [Xanthomonadaceae bacterium]